MFVTDPCKLMWFIITTTKIKSRLTKNAHEIAWSKQPRIKVKLTSAINLHKMAWFIDQIKSKAAKRSR